MNSKKLAVLVIIGLLLMGALGFGVYLKKMNTEGFRGIGISVRGVEKESVENWVETFKSVIQRDEILTNIVTNSEYASKLAVPEGEALEHLRAAITVNHSKTSNSIQIGLRGKRKQNVELDGISQHIFSITAPVVAQVNPDFGAHYQRLSQGAQ